MIGTLLSAVRASDDSSGAGRSGRVMVMAREGGVAADAAFALAGLLADAAGDACDAGRRYW